MGTSSTEYIVHRTLDPQPKYNLVFLQKGDRYCILYEYAVEDGRASRPSLWHDIDVLAKCGVEYLSVSYSAFVEMGEFIRGYVGEARWVLAILANT